MPPTNPLYQSLLTNRAGQQAATMREADLVKKQAELLDYWGQHPNNWIFGHDETQPDSPPLIWTSDPKDPEMGIKPLPDYAYLRLFIHDLHTHNFILLDKCRQMMASTAVLLYIDWLCKFRDARRCVWCKRTEDEAIEMLEDKIRVVHRRLPDWIKLAMPLRDKPAKKLIYPKTGSYILAANETVAKGAGRGGTASVVGIDEGAYTDRFGEVVSAVQPMCEKLIGITTANVSGPGARIYKLLIDEGKGQQVAA